MKLAERYATHALEQLVESDDPAAWNELLCRSFDGETIPQFINHLQEHYEQTSRLSTQAVHEAFDYLRDEWLDSPQPYRSVVSRLREKHPLLRELEFGRTIQSAIRRRASLRLRESKRTNSGTIRYVRDGQTYIFPRGVAVEERGRMIDSCGAAKLTPTETQYRIDEEYGRGLAVFDDSTFTDGNWVHPGDALDRVEARGLVGCLADEKAQNCDDLPVPFQDIDVRSFVLDVCEGLATGEINQKQLAQKYGLSTAAVSRFCAARWDPRVHKAPILFANLASLLAANETFVAAAERAGVWRNVQRLISSNLSII